MKTITIHQPWATLIALGEKRFETRGWATKYRGPLAIHAAKKVDKEACYREPIRSVLSKHGYSADNLPTGAVIATVKLEDCLQIIIAPGTGEVAAWRDADDAAIPIKGNELSFGWFARGRFAWQMVDVKPIAPVPVNGRQGLWNWDCDKYHNEKTDNE
ncbi:ASCH domain-containing protein [Brevibacillus sp. FSL K6-0770]|uniref:ASCH domain-containing protein n=1 Tax=Brevibacillus sp. FSL K6-0770 TaxID=2954673 RepID=UPI0030FB7C1D